MTASVAIALDTTTARIGIETTIGTETKSDDTGTSDITDQKPMKMMTGEGGNGIGAIPLDTTRRPRK